MVRGIAILVFQSSILIIVVFYRMNHDCTIGVIATRNEK